MGAFLFRSGFAHADNVITKRCSKTITWLLLSRLQGNKPHSRELSGTFRKLHPEPTPAHTGTLRNLPPEPTPAHTGTLRNLPPEPHTETLRNLPEPASGTYTRGTFRNLPPEPTPSHTGTPSGTCFRNLHQHSLEPSGTFWNLPPEPASATRTGTHRSWSGLKTPLAYAVGEKTRCLLWRPLKKRSLLFGVQLFIETKSYVREITASQPLTFDPGTTTEAAASAKLSQLLVEVKAKPGENSVIKTNEVSGFISRQTEAGGLSTWNVSREIRLYVRVFHVTGSKKQPRGFRIFRLSGRPAMLRGWLKLCPMINDSRLPMQQDLGLTVGLE